MEKSVVEQHSNKNIKKGTIIGYFSLVINILSGFIFVPLIIQQIGNQYGLFSLATSIINLFLLDFGLSQTANTFLTKYRTEGKNKEINDITGIFYKIYLFLDAIFLIFFIIFFFLIDFIYKGLSSSEIENFKVVFIICVGYSLISLPATTLDGIISSFEEYSFQKITDLIQKIIYIIVTCVTLYFKLGLYFFVLSHAFSTISGIIIKFIFVRKKLNIVSNLKIKLTKQLLKPIVSFSVWTAIISILGRLPYNLSPNILGIVSDSNNVTVFGICSTIEGYAYLISAVIAGFFLPKVSRILSQEKKKAISDLSSLANVVGYAQGFISSLIFAGFLACGKEFIALWLKDYETYQMAYYGTALILFSLLLIVPLTIFNNAMYIYGYVKELAIVDVSSIIVYAVLCFVFSKMFGAFGACFAIFISKILSFVGKIYFFKKRLKIKITPFLFSTYVKFIIPILFTSGAVLLFKSNDAISWKNFIINVCCCLILFIPSSLAFLDGKILNEFKVSFKK